jgi:predicted RND superfamily exporter protein
MLYTKLSKLFRYRYLILIAVALATVFFSVGMTKLTTDMSLQSAVGSKPPLAIKALFKDENKGDRNLSIIVYDNALFTVKNIGRLKVFQEAIENNKYVYSVSSLYNLPDIAYYSLQEKWRPSLSGDEKTQMEVDEEKQFILSNKALLSKYINASATSLAFVVTLKKVPDNQCRSKVVTSGLG